MKQGFDNKIVSYEHIHSIKPEDWKELIKAINPQPKEKILDAFCGYGAVGKSILEKEKTVELWLNDESEVQIKRAKENLPDLSKERFILGHFPKVNLEKESFDKVTIKMGLHEVPKEEQKEVIKKVHEVLKPKGKLIIWNILLEKDNQKDFRKIFKEKDKLAGFENLAKNRYFFREDELINNIKIAGFTKFEIVSEGNLIFSTKKRLESELKNDKDRLDKLNKFIRKTFPENLKQKLNYKDKGDDIQFNIIKKIFVIEK